MTESTDSINNNEVTEEDIKKLTQKISGVKTQDVLKAISSVTESARLSGSKLSNQFAIGSYSSKHSKPGSNEVLPNTDNPLTPNVESTIKFPFTPDSTYTSCKGSSEPTLDTLRTDPVMMSNKSSFSCTQQPISEAQPDMVPESMYSILQQKAQNVLKMIAVETDSRVPEVTFPSANEQDLISQIPSAFDQSEASSHQSILKKSTESANLKNSKTSQQSSSNLSDIKSSSKLYEQTLTAEKKSSTFKKQENVTRNISYTSVPQNNTTVVENMSNIENISNIENKNLCFRTSESQQSNRSTEQCTTDYCFKYNSGSENVLPKESVVSSREPASLLPRESSIVSPKESAVVSPKASAVVSPKASAVVSPKASAVVPPKESAVVSAKESAVVSAKESAVVSAKESAVVSPKESAVVSPRELACLSPRELACLSPREPACLSPREPAVVSPWEPAVVFPREPTEEPSIILPREPVTNDLQTGILGQQCTTIGENINLNVPILSEMGHDMNQPANDVIKELSQIITSNEVPVLTKQGELISQLFKQKFLVKLESNGNLDERSAEIACITATKFAKWMEDILKEIDTRKKIACDSQKFPISDLKDIKEEKEHEDEFVSAVSSKESVANKEESAQINQTEVAPVKSQEDSPEVIKIQELSDSELVEKYGTHLLRDSKYELFQFVGPDNVPVEVRHLTTVESKKVMVVKKKTSETQWSNWVIEVGPEVSLESVSGNVLQKIDKEDTENKLKAIDAGIWNVKKFPWDIFNTNLTQCKVPILKKQCMLTEEDFGVEYPSYPLIAAQLGKTGIDSTIRHQTDHSPHFH